MRRTEKLLFPLYTCMDEFTYSTHTHIYNTHTQYTYTTHTLNTHIQHTYTHIPYSSKFSRHKNFVKHSKFAKLLIFVIKKFRDCCKVSRGRRGLIVAVVPYITTSLRLFPWVCTSHTFLVWLILWPTRTLSRLFSPALLPRICWPPCELNTEGRHLQRERPGRTR